MTFRILDDKAIQAELKSLPGWRHENNSLKRTFKFNSFESAIAFMAQCVPIISKANHHPEWANVYNRIDVTLRTHDAGNVITDKDIAIAKLLEHEYHNGYSK